nr:aldehyde dehydrogenase family protein [uncultured Roseateles sp.]
MAALSVAHAQWADVPLAERAALLRRAFEGLASAPALSKRLSQAQQSLAELSLPGPTGESNELRQHGRGVLAVLANSAAEDQLALALCAALVAGNSVALVVTEAAQAQAAALHQALRQAGLAAETLQLLSGGEACLRALLDDERIAGVVLTGADAALERRLWRVMAADKGAIRPLITAQEVGAASQQYRFSAEQTLTINTAAAGGNAALLAGMH